MSKSGRFGGETRTNVQVGTITDLVQAYSYTLEVGESWQHEKGNCKINRTPKGIKSLIKNIYNAKNNSSTNGYSGCNFEEGVVTDEEKATYWSEREVA